jgi:hypothetical protein
LQQLVAYGGLILCDLFYVGGPAPNGVQELTGDAYQLAHDAYRRALGYSDPHEFEKHRRTNDPELQRRRQEALDKLPLQFGVDWEGVDDAALDRMVEELPEHYKKCLYSPFCVL